MLSEPEFAPVSTESALLSEPVSAESLMMAAEARVIYSDNGQQQQQVQVDITLNSTNEKAAEKDTWNAVLDTASGKEYYVNTRTSETTWTKPACLEAGTVATKDSPTVRVRDQAKFQKNRNLVDHLQL